MITKKSMEKSVQGTSGVISNNNNMEKGGISLNETTQQNTGESNCCTL